jgi:hypothetical protein
LDIPLKCLYREYKQLVLECAETLKERAVAVTYPKEFYEHELRCYIRHDLKHNNRNNVEQINVEQINVEQINNYVNYCSTQAIEFITTFQGNKALKKGKYCPIPPERFPAHVVVIGDITYLIISYGLPMYDHQKTDEKFRAVEHEGLAQLLVYRREDPALADLISSHLKLLVKTRTVSKNNTFPGE